MQTLNNRVSLHRSNIKLTKNTKLFQHLYECRNEMLEIMSIYQTDDNTLLQVTEKLNI